MEPICRRPADLSPPCNTHELIMCGWRAVSRNFVLCQIDALAVAWTLADLAGRTSPGLGDVTTALSFRQGGGVQ